MRARLLNDVLFKRFVTMQTVVRDFLDFTYEENIFDSDEYKEGVDKIYFEDLCELIDKAVFHNKELYQLQSKILNKELFK